MDYQKFLESKIKLDTRMGFDVPGEITFNAAARELYVRAWRAKQKGVVNPSLREILEVER
jgi:hypothetical protein